jgi:osomolarity two-component system phosphorelay intermediate protein YPD1
LAIAVSIATLLIKVLTSSLPISSSKSLEELSSLGHFLKGSSATLGLTRVKDACEKIQHFGAGKDETGSINVSDQALLLGKIKQTLTDVRRDYGDVAKRLKAFYGEQS